MPRLSSQPTKPKHVSTPALIHDGTTLVLRDKGRLKHFTDYEKPKIKDLRPGDELAFLEAGESYVRRGVVTSTTSSEIFVRVKERARLIDEKKLAAGKVGFGDGVWGDIEHDYRISAGAVLGTWEAYTDRIHVVDKMINGRIYGLGHRRGCVPTDLYTASGDPNVPLV